MVGTLPGDEEDMSQHAREIARDLRSAHPDNLDPSFTHPSISLVVVMGAFCPGVMPTVHFHDERGFVTIEISDVRPDRVLTAKPKATELLTPEMVPKHALGRSLAESELVRLARACF